eukprot:15621568-Heterocapsa_arctica.AAC.1
MKWLDTGGIVTEETAKLVGGRRQVTNDSLIGRLISTESRRKRHVTNAGVIDHVLLVQDGIKLRGQWAKIVRKAEAADARHSRPHAVEKRGEVGGAVDISVVAAFVEEDAPSVVPGRLNSNS